MIARLRGILVEKLPTRALVDVEGVGYDVAIPVSTFERLPAAGERVTLLTHLVMREDAASLFAFATPEERDLFRVLITVSGIGPKTGLAILSGIELGRLRNAIAGGEVDVLRAIPGIGKKTAERLIVELRDRLPHADMEPAAAAAARALGCSPEIYRDAVAAMISLGYSNPAAQEAARRVLAAADGPLALDELVKRALGAAR
jgi:Holliday junction DNA helicase RuvA